MYTSCFRSTQYNRGSIISRSRTFYTNGEIKPNNQKKSYENKGYKNNFQQIKYTQQKDTQVIKKFKKLIIVFIVNTFYWY